MQRNDRTIMPFIYKDPKVKWQFIFLLKSGQMSDYFDYEKLNSSNGTAVIWLPPDSMWKIEVFGVIGVISDCSFSRD